MQITQMNTNYRVRDNLKSSLSLSEEAHPTVEDSYEREQHIGKLALGGALVGGLATALAGDTARNIIAGTGGIVGGAGAGFATFGVTALSLGGKSPSTGDILAGSVAGLAVGGGIAAAGLIGGPVLKTVAGSLAGLAAAVAINAAWNRGTR